MASGYGTRAEHMAWAKARANEYADMGDAAGALSSMASDMDKHPETEGHGGTHLGMMLLMSGHLSSPAEIRKFIDGYN